MQRITPFKFLTLEQLKNNTRNLIATVREQDEKTHDQLNEAREKQIKLLDGIYEEMEAITRSMTESSEELENHYLEKQNVVALQILELHEKAELTAEEKALEKKLQQEVARLGAIISSLMETRKVQDKNLSDERKVRIATGRFLQIAKELEYEFNTIANRSRKKLGYESSLQKCVLYTGIPEAIGVTEENKLDASSKKEALWQHDLFVGMKQLNAKQNLKEVKTQEVQHSLEPSLNPLMIKPDAKWKKQAEDKKLHPKVRKSAADELAKYKEIDGKTDAEIKEFFYQNYDVMQPSTHSTMNKIFYYINHNNEQKLFEEPVVKTMDIKEANAYDKAGKAFDHYNNNVVSKISSPNVKLKHIQTEEKLHKQVNDVLVNGDTIKDYDSKAKIERSRLFPSIAKPTQSVEPVVNAEEEKIATMKI